MPIIIRMSDKNLYLFQYIKGGKRINRYYKNTCPDYKVITNKLGHILLNVHKISPADSLEKIAKDVEENVLKQFNLAEINEFRELPDDYKGGCLMTKVDINDRGHKISLKIFPENLE